MATVNPSDHITPTENPAMVIRAVTPSITTFSMPFSRFGKVHFGLRCTAVRLQSGSLAIFSACPLTPTVLNTLTTLSPDPAAPTAPNVRYLIAPDIEHHLHIGQWKKAFPSAHILAPDGLREKRAKQGYPDADTPYAHVWKAGAAKRTDEGKYGVIPEEFKNEFDVEYFDAHANKDVAFLHKPDGGTFINADLFFNLPGGEQYQATQPKIDPSSGIFTKLALYFTHGPRISAAGDVIPGSATGNRRFGWWVLGAKNRKGYAESVKVVSGWRFKRIISCHGDVVEDGPKEGTANAAWDEISRWYLDMKA